MRFLKAILKLLFWSFILVLLLAPLALIYGISQAEMRQYDTAEAPVLQETAYGAVMPAFRTDMKDTVTVSGQFISNTCEEFSIDWGRPDLVHWFISEGSEITEGEVIGTIWNEELTSPLTGIVDKMSTYTTGNAYIRVRLLEPLVLSCRVNDAVLNSLQTAAELTLTDGTPVELLRVGFQRNEDNTSTVELRIDREGYSYGQRIEALALYTGYGYSQALVVDEKCVYRKPGDEEHYYMRQVTEEGFFLREVEVKTGFSSGGLICVSGVDEGQFFDSGYKQIVEGAKS